ncbi:MAG: proton-conducting transporter membrane subunit [Coriobacteriia bacterium]|nr:proton-conducting transporter membrane subunit [Coriobacteriia bacterium]
MSPDVWWVLIAPLIIATFAGIAALVADAWSKRLWALSFSLIGLVGAAAASVWISLSVEGQLIADVMLVDRGLYGVWTAAFALSALSLAAGAEFVRTHPSGGGVAGLVAFTAAGSAALASSIDLLFTLLLLETIAVAGYALIAAVRTPASGEAALKYVVQGAVATGLFLLGLAISVGVLGGSTAIVAVGTGANSLALPATGAALFIVIAFAFKLGAFPLHSWVPDSYETATPMASAVLAGVPKLGALSALLIFAEVVMRPVESVGLPGMQPTVVFAALAIGSIVFGNLGALRQSSFGRMLGYSGIAQAGYVLIGVTAGLMTYPGALLLMATYGLAAATAFACAEALRIERGGWDGTIAAMAGLSVRRPALAVSLAVAMLSLTGIPLFGGFWGKLLVFGTVSGQGFAWLAIIGVLGSVVSFGYYGAVIRTAFFDPADDARQTEIVDRGGAKTTVAPFVIAVFGAFLILAIGVVPLFTGLTPLVRFFGIGG